MQLRRAEGAAAAQGCVRRVNRADSPEGLPAPESGTAAPPVAHMQPEHATSAAHGAPGEQHARPALALAHSLGGELRQTNIRRSKI